MVIAFYWKNVYSLIPRETGMYDLSWSPKCILILMALFLS